MLRNQFGKIRKKLTKIAFSNKLTPEDISRIKIRENTSTFWLVEAECILFYVVARLSLQKVSYHEKDSAILVASMVIFILDIKR